MTSMHVPPSHASIVIVGGGIIGLSLAYHLARRGREGVVLLERRQFTCGTTWHAAGLVRSAAPYPALAAILADSARLYAELEAETGQATGFRQTGSIYTASNAERGRSCNARPRVRAPWEPKSSFARRMTSSVSGRSFVWTI